MNTVDESIADNAVEILDSNKEGVEEVEKLAEDIFDLESIEDLKKYF